MVVVSGHGVDTERRAKVFQDRCRSFDRKVSPADHSGDHEVAGKQDQVGPRGIRHIHNAMYLGVVDEWRSGVKIANHGNAELTDLRSVASGEKDFMASRPNAGRLDPESIGSQTGQSDERERPSYVADQWSLVWRGHPCFHSRSANYVPVTSQSSRTR